MIVSNYIISFSVWQVFMRYYEVSHGLERSYKVCHGHCVALRWYSVSCSDHTEDLTTHGADITLILIRE